MDFCPNCGYTAITPQKPFSNVMKTYVSPDGKKAIFNSDEEKLNVGKTPETAVVWTREDIFDKQPKKEIKAELPAAPKK